jgi:phage terminase small subunit
MMAHLTPKQVRFIDEYLVDLNATQAAVRAGYSAKMAASIGHENLRKPEIASAIAEEQGVRSVRLGITADRVLQELARIAFSDIRQVVTWGEEGLTLRPSSGLSADIAAVVQQISQTADGRHHVKLHPKLDALDKLARHLGLYDGRAEQNSLQQNSGASHDETLAYLDELLGEFSTSAQ